MGYYTDYTLTVEHATPEDLENIGKTVHDEWGMESWDDGWGCNDKWYDHDEDMLVLSIRFPHIVFELHGAGENNDDLWYTYYKNGKKQHCPAIITFDPYDESKLE